MMGYGYHGDWGMGGAGWFGMILFWILAILAIVWLLRALELGRGLPGVDPHRNRRTGREDRAISILRERYARGEIDSDEFQRRKQDLEGNGTAV